MPSTLFVLAASAYQLDAMRTAQRLGYRVITADNVPSNPGHLLADKSFNIDTTDIEAIFEIAKRERISGIIAPCTDVAVVTAATVAQRLNLSGPPIQGSKIATDKSQFRSFLKHNEFAVPLFQTLDRGEGPASGLFEKSQRWIVKPDRSSGSKGIFIISDDGDLPARIEQSRAFSPTGRVVLESFIDGHQGTVEGVLVKGAVKLQFILDRQTAPPPYVTTTGHYLPTILPESAQQKIIESIERAWNLLGVTDGVFDCDFVWSEGLVYLLEMTPRLGGNSISQLLRNATKFDLVEYAVKEACGDRIPLPSPAPVIQPSAVVILGVWEEGHLRIGVDPEVLLARRPWVTSLKLDVQPGARVHPFMNGRYRIGEAYIEASTRAEIPRLVAALNRDLALKVE